MELKFIGTGSCFNFDRGNNSAYMKWGENNESMLLIDCGCDVCEKIVRNNLLDGVKNLYIAITHLHDDHSGSLGQLIDYCYYVKNIIVNLIFPPQDTIEVMLSTKMISINKYKFYGCYSYTNESTSWFKLGNRGPMIKFTQTSHKEGYNSFSIILCNDEITILHTRDTNNLDINGVNNEFSKSGDKFKLYTECTFTPEFSNVHVYYKTLFGIPEEYRKNVTVMHLDDNPEKIQELREAGFNIAESELRAQQFDLNSYKSNINDNLEKTIDVIESENIEVVLPIRVPSYTTEENLKEELSNGTDKDRFDEMIKYGILWASGVEPKVSDTLAFLSQDPSERICRIINIDVEKLEVTCIFRQSYLDKFDIDKNNLSSYEIEFLALGNFVGRRAIIKHLTYPVLKKKIEFKKDKLKKELKDPKDHDIQVSTGTIKDIITHPEKYEDMFKEE